MYAIRSKMTAYDKKHFWIHVSYLEGENHNHIVSYLLKSSKAPNR